MFTSSFGLYPVCAFWFREESEEECYRLNACFSLPNVSSAEVKAELPDHTISLLGGQRLIATRFRACLLLHSAPALHAYGGKGKKARNNVCTEPKRDQSFAFFI